MKPPCVRCGGESKDQGYCQSCWEAAIEEARRLQREDPGAEQIYPGVDRRLVPLLYCQRCRKQVPAGDPHEIGQECFTVCRLAPNPACSCDGCQCKTPKWQEHLRREEERWSTPRDPRDE